MKTIALFDAKPYDKEWFEQKKEDFTFQYIDSKLNAQTAALAEGCEAVCAFVNDEVNKETIDKLTKLGIEILAMRCAGYSNVDFKAAYGRLHVVRVPAYSPYAVAEHAMALLLAVNRKIHKAYNRTRDFNFSLAGLTGMDLHGKTVGIIGTGKIGQAYYDICKGFGMEILAYDLYPAKHLPIKYVELDELFAKSDVISLHCPLSQETEYILSQDAFEKMKRGVYLVNTSRGGLIDSQALLDALNEGKVAGAGLDVYEEEADFFYEDRSDSVVRDDTLSLLISKPNVLVTSHQAFLTNEALSNIAEITVQNLAEYFTGAPLTNEVCYQCESGQIKEGCKRTENGRCF